MTQLVGPESPVDRLLRRSAVRIRADQRIGEVARIMREENISSVLVGRDAAGIVTERDLVRALTAGVGPEAQIGPFVVPDPLTVPPTTTVIEAAATMLREEVRHLAVTSPGRPPAIISLRDVMAILLEALDPGVWMETLHLAVTTRSELWIG
jgi:CBS domain-containing protein